MVSFGSSLLSWIPKWSAGPGFYTIKQASQDGFDLIEILLPTSLDFDAKTVKSQLSDYGIAGRLTLNLPPEFHITLNPVKAIKYIKEALDKVSDMDGDFLGGVLHSAIGTFTGNQLTEIERSIITLAYKDLVIYAEERGITIAIEPINRYESYVFTSANEVLEMIDEIGSQHLGLHLDTFHMNIEENNFRDPILKAGNRLKHVHITESDRGMLGEGNVHWDDLFRSLKAINYSGPLVLENFSSEISELIPATSLWRNSKYNSKDLRLGSLEFMKMKAKEFHMI